MLIMLIAYVQSVPLYTGDNFRTRRKSPTFHKMYTVFYIEYA